MKKSNLLFAAAFALAIGGAALTHAGSIGNSGFQNPGCQPITTSCDVTGAHDCEITVYKESTCQTLLTKRP